MNIEVVPAEQKDKPVLRQLMELYNHDFSEFTKEDVNEHGFFDYPYLDNYWTKKTRHPFFIKVDGNIAGFVLVSYWNEAYNISEFFVMRKYRKTNVGNTVAKHVFNLFKGDWKVEVLNVNLPALPFWCKVISEYTNGDYNYHPEPTDNWDGVSYTFCTEDK